MTAFQDFAHSVKAEIRFVRTSRQEKFLPYVIATSPPRIAKLPQGSELWRAQLGHDWCERIVDGDKPIPVRCGYKPERMKPRPKKASDGRTNPKGIPSLYLGTRAEAPILEVRPLIGSYNLVARFRLSIDIEIIDCTTDHFHWLDLTRGKISRKKRTEEKEKLVWGDVNRAFSQPSQRGDESVDYVPTQILAETFKSKGFDGIAYKSSYGEKGFNIAIFDLDAADVLGRISLCRADDIKVKITPEEDL
jgi:hypothetical protein